MTAPGPHQYDDPTSRTRMAWGRTALAATVVTALAARGIAVRGGPPLLVAAVLVLGAVVAVAAVSRMRYLVRHRTRILPSTMGIVVGGVIVLVIATAVGLARPLG